MSEHRLALNHSVVETTSVVWRQHEIVRPHVEQEPIYGSHLLAARVLIRRGVTSEVLI